MTVHPESATGEIKRLQRCISDLISIFALPATWVGGDPFHIGRTVLSALLGMLGLDLVYTRLTDMAEAAPIEMVRFADPQLPVNPADIRRMLGQWIGTDPQSWPSSMRNPFGKGEISIMALRLGSQGEIGVIVAGSCRTDFPRRTERLLLGVAANQMTIGLQEARLLGEQKRLADELDQRVALRTRELATVNEDLRLQVGILQHIPVAAWTVGPDGSPDFVNRIWLEYTGQTLDHVRSNREAWMTAIHPEDRRRAWGIFWDGISSGKGFTMEARIRRARDGAYRWHLNRAVALRDADGNILRFVGTSTDIEDLKRFQDKLGESEQNLRQMTETIPEMLWSATPTGAIDYCNTRMLDYTGFTADDIMGDGWVKLLHPDDVDRTVRVWKSCVASGASYRVEVRTFHVADRTYRWCVTSARPMRDGEGRILRWHGTVVDMHDWKTAQQELRDTQAELAHVTRAMAMGALTASIAHEVNQPLSGIITNANTCLRMLGADPPNVAGARETARRTIRDGNRASQVITHLSALFRKKEATNEPVDLNEATREVLALSESQLLRSQVVLRQALADDLPLVMGDRVQLQQVILNLVLNAADAMGGIENRLRSLVVTTRRDEDNGVRLDVRDSGIGIDPQIAERIFKAFYTTKIDGMGIGLFVSRSIINSHRGHIWATSNEGPGATFSFWVPCSSERVANTRNPDAPKAQRRSTRSGTQQTEL